MPACRCPASPRRHRSSPRVPRGAVARGRLTLGSSSKSRAPRRARWGSLARSRNTAATSTEASGSSSTRRWRSALVTSLTVPPAAVPPLAQGRRHPRRSGSISDNLSHWVGGREIGGEVAHELNIGRVLGHGGRCRPGHHPQPPCRPRRRRALPVLARLPCTFEYENAALACLAQSHAATSGEPGTMRGPRHDAVAHERHSTDRALAAPNLAGHVSRRPPSLPPAA